MLQAEVRLEPSLGDVTEPVQFERLGYFTRDSEDASVFNRIVTLRDTWAKIEKKLSAGS